MGKLLYFGILESMPINLKLLKKILIAIFIIAGLFIGYQLVTGTDEAEDPSTDTTQSEQGYAEEDLRAFEEKPTGNVILDEKYGQKIRFTNSFEHTKPGEFSEIIVNAEGFEPGEFTIVYVRFAGTEEYIAAGGQEHTADSDGKISTRFLITQFGEYEVLVASDGTEYTSETIYVE